MKVKSVKQLKKIADSVFSLYIRTRDKGVCYTCGLKKQVKKMQCGHYVSRAWNPLRYDPANCHCQCYGCNICRKGNMDEYAIRLQKEYGNDILDLLHERKKVYKFTTTELENIIEHWTNALKELK